jgi:hypothetical protein
MPSFVCRAATSALLVSGLAAAFLLVPSCAPSDDSNEGEACVTARLDCQPIVSPPTFDALYANIFKTSCAAGTGSCHGSARAGGLDMETVDAAYAGLSARSQPSDVGCSLLLKRVESTKSSYRMPPGSAPLSEPQLCAIRQWIANGAKR